ncbi:MULTISPECIES: AAA family ATPase [Rhodomicrobium]|uniref:AAA family ATPase n=1 Tax=Rhodomicrobium TaxID=1068 RepID=UPI001483BD07|nr:MULTISPECIES: AAA family ATPase [Rhodomicrobium]
MQIRRIEIRDFRKLSHVLIENLEDGLNVLVGDNEAGKSTLLAALRAVLFERHRVSGDVAARMQPYGQSVRPEVAIEFDLGGKSWKLRKAFCQKPEAELIGPGERATGDAVEERLAELFGFNPPGRGQSKPEEHQGIYGLLWVEQGGSHRSLGVGAGRNMIASALELEVGEVVGGERGRALLAAAEERRNGFWDKRGNPRGDYKALRDEVAALEARQGDLTAQLADYDEKIAALEKKSEALARYGREDHHGKAMLSVEAAKAAVQRSEKLDAAVKSAAERLDRLRLERDAAAERKDAREKLAAAVEAARKAVAAAQSEADDRRALLARHEAAAAGAEANFAEARKARQQADDRVRAMEQAIAHAQAAALLRDLDERLTAAENAEAKRREHTAAAEAITIRKPDIAALEKLQSESDRARLQLEAASVRIAFEPEGARGVSVDGEAHDAGEPLRLSRDAVLELQGYGRLRIHPGGGVEALRQAADAAAASLKDRLAKLGFADLAAAREALARGVSARQEADALAKTIAALAPQGLDVLRQSVESQRNLAERPLTEMAAAITEASDARLAELIAAQRKALKAEQSAETALASARTGKEEAGREAATLAERSAAAQRRQEASVQDLTAARAQAGDKDLLDALAAATDAAGLAEKQHAEAKAALDAAEPDAVLLELQRAERAERAIRTDIDSLTRDKRDIEIELKALGRDGLGEQLAEITGQRDAAASRIAALHAEAAAARLLHDTLAEAQRETKDRWLGPVRERVKPYLKLIQPDSDIVLNEDTLEIEHFVRKGVREPFHSLSVGAREQVAVIARLALADILRASGQPSAIILDDALVNTDEGRLERMHLVLQKAAQALQVLVLTCRERDFLQLGAPIKRI